MLFENSEFLPDQPDFGNPGSTIAENVYPITRGYAPFGSLMYLSTAMDARPLGATSLTSADGTSRVYAGNATKLYSLGGAATTDISLANICLQSEDVTTTWTNTNSTDTANSAVAPDSATTADTLTEDATASDNHALYQDITITAAAHTFSVYVKEPGANSRRYITVELSNSANSAHYGRATFDIQGGVISTAAAAATFTSASAVITSIGSDWYRCSITVTSTVTTGRVSIYLNDDGTDSGISYNGDGASELYVWGFQLELGSTVGGYAPTTTVAVDGYTNTATFWDFAAYGDIAVATNYADFPQFIDMSDGVTFVDLTTDFKARTVATVRDFLMFGNTWDATDGAKPERVRWSANGDHTDYTVSATTQSDYQDTPGGGAVQRVFGGEYATVLFEHAIYRVNYVGSPNVFQFDQVATDIGLFAPGAAAQNGSVIYFLDSGGFYAFNGNQSFPIGNEKVDDWFWGKLDASQAARISCAVDHDKKCVAWSFPGPANVSGKPTHIIIFNYELSRWSYALLDNDLILPLLTSDITLDTLDNLNNDVDDLTISVDSRILFEGSALLGVMDSFKLASNQGTPLAAIVESKEMQPNQDRRSHITEVWPLNDGATTTVQIGTRDRQQDAYSWSTATSVNTTGFAPVSVEGRYVRVRQNLSGDWGDSQGVDVVAKRRGRF